jgi:hypothetical protein
VMLAPAGVKAGHTPPVVNQQFLCDLHAIGTALPPQT